MASLGSKLKKIRVHKNGTLHFENIRHRFVTMTDKDYSGFGFMVWDCSHYQNYLDRFGNSKVYITKLSTPLKNAELEQVVEDNPYRKNESVVFPVLEIINGISFANYLIWKDTTIERELVFNLFGRGGLKYSDFIRNILGFDDPQNFE